MENLNEVIERLKTDTEFSDHYTSLQSMESILAQAKKDGYEVTREDVLKLLSQIRNGAANNGSVELSDAELAVVSGGDVGKMPPSYTDNYDPVRCAPGKSCSDGFCFSGDNQCTHFCPHDGIPSTCGMGAF